MSPDVAQLGLPDLHNHPNTLASTLPIFALHINQIISNQILIQQVFVKHLLCAGHWNEV